MGFYLYDQLLGLLIFFSVLCTITVGLRLLVRTKLTKGAFGWDDVVLVFSYVSRQPCPYHQQPPSLLSVTMYNDMRTLGGHDGVRGSVHSGCTGRDGLIRRRAMV